MKRHFYLVAGWASLGLGAIGAFVPLLPTVPFVILAAFCFARSSPQLESWLLTHPHFGHHIVAWREKGAISRKGKVAATAAFCIQHPVGRRPFTVAVGDGSGGRRRGDRKLDMDAAGRLTLPRTTSFPSSSRT